MEQAEFYNMKRMLNIHYIQKCNGRIINVVSDRWFFNRVHFQVCLDNWNALGRQMAKSPCPFSGMVNMWSYEETP